MKVYDFKIDRVGSLLLVDTKKPTFSWKLASDNQNVVQKKYELVAYRGGEKVWGIAKRSAQSVSVEYNGDDLLPFCDYFVKLTVTDNYGEEGTAELTFTTGALGTPFTAKFISATDSDMPVYALKKKIAVEKPVKRALLYTSALGLYDFDVNGVKAGDEYFAPYWTDYRHTIEYQAHDVTNLLKTGENELAMIIGKGWYAGVIGFVGEKGLYGTRTAGLAELKIEYADGEKEIIVTDESWTAESCYITDSEFYYGEKQNAYFDKKSCATEPVETEAKLVGQKNEPVRCIERLSAKEKILTPKNEQVFDMGQNMAGVVEIKVRGNKGDKITVSHAEVLDEQGNFYVANLRAAISVDEYVLTGEEQVLSPRFTYHGFRYVRIEGVELDKENVTGLVLCSDMKRTGRFSCSDKRINRLFENALWGQKGNFIDVPTDCPQRDERLGWTGDANVFFRTASLNYDVSAFFSKWLDDVATEQGRDGNVPHVVPNVMGESGGAALWSDCVTMISWKDYLVYGNKTELAERLYPMKRWVEYISDRCEENGLWQTGFQYGDWLALDSGNPESRTGATDKYLVANIFYYVSANYVAHAAKAVGDVETYEEFRVKREKILKAIRREYITSTGRIVGETQTALALCLHFGIIPSKFKSVAAKNLKNALAENKNHLNTGFAGTPFLLFALSDNGMHDVATKLIFNDDYPSWLYEVDRGATTIWERWNCIQADGTLYDPGMNSFNHYAYGSVAEFFYRRIAGIDAGAPAYSKIILRPRLTVGMTEVCAEYESVYGKIRSSYICKDGKIKVAVEIPCNTKATLYLPEKTATVTLGSGKYEYEYETTTDLTTKRFSFETTFGALIQYKEAVDLLEKLSPGIMGGPMIAFAKDMKLSELVAFSGEQGVALFGAVVDEMNKLFPD